MNELTLDIRQNPGVIELNFDDIERALDQKLEEYKGAVFTEESKVIAKKEVASLRKLKSKFEDARKSVKREWMKPYDEFEERMKKLTAKIDKPINLINDQVEEFERHRKEKRRTRIQEIYQDLIGDMGDYCELGQIYDPKWENATTTEKMIKENISAVVESARTAVNTITGMQSEAVEKALDIYKMSMDMAKAIGYINNYEQQKAEIMKREEARRKEYEERRRKEEDARRKEKRWNGKTGSGSRRKQKKSRSGRRLQQLPLRQRKRVEMKSFRSSSRIQRLFFTGLLHPMKNLKQ